MTGVAGGPGGRRPPVARSPLCGVRNIYVLTVGGYGLAMERDGVGWEPLMKPDALCQGF